MREARAPVIDRVMEANPIGYVQVELSVNDIDNLFLMAGAHEQRRPLRPDADRQAASLDSDGEYTRKLIAERNPIKGVLFAVGRAMPGELTILDGIHRAAAWVKHSESGAVYPARANVAITLDRVWWEGRPA